MRSEGQLKTARQRAPVAADAGRAVGSTALVPVARLADLRGGEARSRGAATVLPPFTRIFVEIRSILRLGVADVAHRLATTPEIIEALETGRLEALPRWSETERIVTLYASALRLDPKPALSAIAAEIELAALTRRAALPPAATSALPASRALVPQTSLAERGMREGAAAKDWLAGRLATLSQAATVAFAGRLPSLGRLGVVVAVLALAGSGVLVAQSSVLKAAVRRLPAPATDFVRSASDSMMLLFAPKREGLRWIEVADPRSRRADKLQITRR